MGDSKLKSDTMNYWTKETQILNCNNIKWVEVEEKAKRKFYTRIASESQFALHSQLKRI